MRSTSAEMIVSAHLDGYKTLRDGQIKSKSGAIVSGYLALSGKVYYRKLSISFREKGTSIFVHGRSRVWN